MSIETLKTTSSAAAIARMIEPWTGDHGGYPDLAVSPAEIEAALMAGMEQKRLEIEAIAHQAEAATFQNTIAALESAGRQYDRATSCFGAFVSSNNSATMQQLDKKLAPVRSAFGDELILNAALFARIEAVYESREHSGLTSEQLRITKKYYDKFVLEGARLDRKKKVTLVKVNKRLASLHSKFQQNVQNDALATPLVLEKADLDGLPANIVEAAANAAAKKRKRGKFMIANNFSAMTDFLKFSTRRDLRQRAFELFTRRGDNDNKFDNKAIASQIAQLRAKKADLLGFDNFAQLAVSLNMAGTPEAALDLMLSVWEPAVARAREEIEEMEAIAGHKIEPWDHRFWTEEIRRRKYALDQQLISEYLQLDRIVEAMFWVAGQVFGIRMEEVHGISGVDPEVRVFEVFARAKSDPETEKRIGLFYFDPFARPGKKDGAWMAAYRLQEKFAGPITPIIVNCLNFAKGMEGAPTLLSWDNSTTLFHEFGHALHGLLSDVNYPTLACTQVQRDFVEFPSQMFEHWLMTDEVLKKFAVHYETGKPMPDDLIAKINAAKAFNQGFASVEYLAPGLFDMLLHLRATKDKPIDIAQFEQEIMTELGCPTAIVMRHRPTHFSHIFAGSSYAAGYYVYIWADTKVAQGASIFRNNGGFYNPPICRRLHVCIYSKGDSKPGNEVFDDFAAGFEVDDQALLRERGFLPAAA